MFKPEVIAAVAEDTMQTKTDVERTINSLLDTISGQLAKGNEVAFVGFGTFSVKNRAARDGRNPQTGQTIKIAASNVPVFKPGSKLKDAVN